MRSWCFDSQESGGVYDREYGSADVREVVYKIVGNGLFMDTSTSLQVVADSGLTVKVQPGNCFINGAFGAVDTAESLTFDASASGRYDIVVARFDLSLSYRSIRLVVVKGTEGSSSAPMPTKTASVYDLQLAKVNIRTGAASILQSDITDTRTDPTVCGVVNGVSSQAAALQAQITDLGSAKQDKTNALATEATLDDADTIPFYDASASAHRKTLWSNIKMWIKASLSKNDVGLSNVANERQYSAANPQPRPMAENHTIQGGAGVQGYSLPFKVRFALVKTPSGMEVFLPGETKTVHPNLQMTLSGDGSSFNIYWNSESDISVTLVSFSQN